MQIEFIGSTGAGKSTLARRVLLACRAQGLDACLADEFVLQRLRLNGVKGHLPRTLLVDLCALALCLLTWRRHRAFYRLALPLIWRLRAPWLEKANLMRNVLKKIGIYEIVSRRPSQSKVVLVDEGTLHAAHNLFVHVSGPGSRSDLEAFGRLAPLPDMAVYVAERESVLIQRTLQRGHKRIPDRSYASVEHFVREAIETFDLLTRQLVGEGRLLPAPANPQLMVNPRLQAEPLVSRLAEIVRAQMPANIPVVPAAAMRGGLSVYRSQDSSAAMLEMR